MSGTKQKSNKPKTKIQEGIQQIFTKHMFFCVILRMEGLLKLLGGPLKPKGETFEIYCSIKNVFVGPLIVITQSHYMGKIINEIEANIIG